MRKPKLSTLCRDWDTNFHRSVRENLSRISSVPAINSEEYDTSKKTVLHKTLPYYLNKPLQLYLTVERKDKKSTTRSAEQKKLPKNSDWSNVYWTVHHCDNWRIKNQLDAIYYFIVLLIGSTRFGHYCAHQQELATMMLITTLVVSFLVCCMLEVRCG